MNALDRILLEAWLVARTSIRLASLLTTIAFVVAYFPATPARAEQEESGTDVSGATGGDLTTSEVGGMLASTVSASVQAGGAGHVSPSGSYTASFPIEVPPGIQGVQPNLAITYDSQAPNGMLGVGMTLTGIPAIVRTAGIVGANDEDDPVKSIRPRSLRFDSHDSFSVAAAGFGTAPAPGTRLVEVEEGTGLFHTARESWTQYRPLGRCAGDGAEGVEFAPCAWEARDGHGNTLYFGLRPSGQLWERDAGHDAGGADVERRGIHAWGLTHFVDALGNAYRVRYEQDDWMLRPLRIEYGCDLAVTPPPHRTPPPDPDDRPDDPEDGDPAMPDPPDEPVEWGLIGTENPMTPLPPFGVVEYDPGTAPTPEPTDWSGTFPIDDEVGGGDSPGSDFSCSSRRYVMLEYSPETGPDRRPDPTPLPHRHTKRLERIRVFAGAEEQHAYTIAYEESMATHASRVASLTRTADGLSTPPVTFTWSDGTSLEPDSHEVRGWAVDEPADPSVESDQAPVRTLTGDIDGDGFDDIVRVAHGNKHRASYVLGRDINAAGLESAPAHDLTVSIPVASVEGDVEVEDPSDQAWGSLLVDTNADGMDDLVFWRASFHQGEMHIAHGTTSGLLPMAPYAFNAAFDDFADEEMVEDQIPADVARWYQLLPGDFNGDQVTDLALVHTWRMGPRVALMTGSVDGLTAPVERLGRSFGIDKHTVEHEDENGDTQDIEKLPVVASPVVGDFDGDGLQDIAFNLTSGHGTFSQLFLGHFHRGLRAGFIINWTRLNVRGYAPATTIVGDFNGDGASDMTLFYSGNTKPYFVNWGRTVYSWLGQADLLGLPRLPFLYRLDNAIEFPSLISNPAYPESVANNPIKRRRWATWRHHGADFNGDGSADVAATYDGVEGHRAEYALADARGRFADEFTPITACGGQDTGCAPAADGGANSHKWTTRPIDLDADGYDDLVRYYAGINGTFIDVAPGGPDGLGPYASLVDDPGLVANYSTALGDASRSASVSASFPDLNGDGRREVVLSSYDAVVVVTSDPGTASAPAVADLLVAVDNGFGGIVDVQYASAVRHAGAVDPSTTACGDATVVSTAGEPCGLPRRDARYLATRVREENGREDDRTTTYSYANGRYYPGLRVWSPLAWPSPSLTPSGPRDARADLGFRRVTSTRVEDGLITTTHFRQDRPFARRVARVETSVPSGEPGGGSVLLSRATFTHDSITNAANGIVRIRGTGGTRTGYEDGTPSTFASELRYFDDFDRPVSMNECSWSDCYETATVFETETDPHRWILQRVSETKRRNLWGGSGHIDNVLAWQRFRYNADRLEKTESLLCDDMEQCRCFESPDATACVGSGTARWVTELRVDDSTGSGWDPHGNPLMVRDAHGSLTEFTYNQWQAAVATQKRHVTGTSVAHLTTQWTYDGMGRVVVETDVDNSVSAVSNYDALGRPTSVVHPDGRVESWDYRDDLVGDPAAQKVAYTTTTDVAGPVEANEQFFDGFGGVYKRVAYGPGGQPVVVRQERDHVNGQAVVWRSEPYFLGAPENEVVWDRITSDARGRVLVHERERDPFDGAPRSLGVVQTRTYAAGSRTIRQSTNPVDLDGQVLYALPWREQTVSFDSRGIVTGIDEPGRRVDYVYNDALQLENVYGPYDPASPAVDTPYKLWWYDSAGQVSMYEDDASGSSSFTYDDLGLLESSTDALGRQTSWGYDELGRPRTKTTADGVTHFVYDDLATPAGKGRVKRVSGPWGERSVAAYDPMGRPLGQTLTIGSVMGPMAEAYQHDFLGRPRRRTLPDGTVIEYAYGLAGVLDRVEVDGVALATFGGYDARGQVGTRTTAASTTTFTYDSSARLHELVAESNAGGSNPIMAYRYGYTQGGDLLVVDDIRAELGGTTADIPGWVDTNDSWTFEYDLLGRLSTATAYDGAATDYGYDPADRITQKGAMSISHTGSFVQGSEGALLRFDWTRNAVGAVISSGPGAPKIYDYNADNRLATVTRSGQVMAEFLYDEAGQRIFRSEQVKGAASPTEVVDHFYVSPNYEIEVRQDPTTGLWEQAVTKHIDAPGMGVIATISGAGVSTASTTSQVLAASQTFGAGPERYASPVGTWYHHANHLGSTSVVTDDTGEVVSRYVYNPYGTRNDRSIGMDVADREFTGQIRDAGTDLYYYNARYYDAKAGLFITPDTQATGMPYFAGGINNPAGLNRYAYAYNNPVTYTDPSGHEPGVVEFDDDEVEPIEIPSTTVNFDDGTPNASGPWWENTEFEGSEVDVEKSTMSFDDHRIEVTLTPKQRSEKYLRTRLFEAEAKVLEMSLELYIARAETKALNRHLLNAEEALDRQTPVYKEGVQAKWFLIPKAKLGVHAHVGHTGAGAGYEYGKDSRGVDSWGLFFVEGFFMGVGGKGGVEFMEEDPEWRQPTRGDSE